MNSDNGHLEDGCWVLNSKNKDEVLVYMIKWFYRQIQKKKMFEKDFIKILFGQSRGSFNSVIYKPYSNWADFAREIWNG